MNSRALIVAVLGACIAVPLQVIVAGAPVFPLAAAAVCLGLFVYLISHAARPLWLLDQLVVLYLAWIAFGYLLNLPAFWLSGDAGLVAKQFVSLLTAFFVVSPYLLGRYYFVNGQDIRIFLQFLVPVYFVVVVAIVVYFIFNFADLFLARATVEQRIPMMIVFLSWAICGGAFWKANHRKFLIAIWVLAGAATLLSLTRAAYLQWVLSAVAFVFASVRTRKIRLRTVLTVGLIAAAVVSPILLSFDVEKGVGVGVITERADELLTLNETLSTDESATVRLEIWQRLWGRLTDSPTRLLVGFGQLGPSAYLGGTFTSLSGQVIDVYNAHSEYLDTIVRSGIPGLALELLITGTVIWLPFSRFGKFIHDATFFQLHSVALGGILVYGIFHETLRWQLFGIYFWLYAGMLSAQLNPGAVSPSENAGVPEMMS